MIRTRKLTWLNTVKLRTTSISLFFPLVSFFVSGPSPGSHVAWWSCLLQSGTFLSLFLSFTTLTLLRKSCSQLFCKMSFHLGLSDGGGPHRLRAGRLREGRGSLGGPVGRGLDGQRWKEDPSCQENGVQAHLSRSPLLCSSSFAWTRSGSLS